MRGSAVDSQQASHSASVAQRLVRLGQRHAGGLAAGPERAAGMPVQVASGQPHGAQPRQPLGKPGAQSGQLGVEEAQVELDVVADWKMASELAEQHSGDVGKPWCCGHVAGAQTVDPGWADVAFGVDQRAELRHDRAPGVQTHDRDLHNAVGAW